MLSIFLIILHETIITRKSVIYSSMWRCLNIRYFNGLNPSRNYTLYTICWILSAECLFLCSATLLISVLIFPWTLLTDWFVVETRVFLSEQETEILGTLTKFRKEIISGVMSVCPSVRVEHWGSHWTDFLKWNLISEYCSCRYNSSFIKIGQE